MNSKNNCRLLQLCSVVVVAGALLVPAKAGAQNPPPIEGITGGGGPAGAMVPEQAANAAIVKTAAGVGRLFHFTKVLFVRGGKSRSVDDLQGLRDGTTVTVHDASTDADARVLEIDQVGHQELSVTEGTVVRIDRGRQQITIRFDDGQDERLQLTGRPRVADGAIADQASDDDSTVTVFYAEAGGGPQIAHFFEKMS